MHAAEADDRGPLFSSSHSQSEEVIYVVGRIVRAWSGIEFTVDSSIQELLSRPDTRDMDTALVLPFRARTELLEQLLAEAIDDASTVTNLHNLINQIKSLQNYRDIVVHGIVTRAASHERGLNNSARHVAVISNTSV
jgi:hypothetical protein